MASQPSNIEPYIQSANPVTKEPLEQEAAKQRHQPGQGSSTSGRTVPSETARFEDAVPTSLGYGVQGSGPVDAQEARSTGTGQTAKQLENENVDAEQMATLGEGDVADAVDRKSGTQKAPGTGEMKVQDFASDLDRKKAEQAADRQEIQEARRNGVDVDGGADSRAVQSESLAEA